MENKETLKQKIEDYARQLKVDVDNAMKFYEFQLGINRKRAYERAIVFIFNENENTRCY